MEKRWQQKTDFLASELERKKGPDDCTKLKYIALEKVKRIGMNLEQKMQTEQGMIVNNIKKYRADRDRRLAKEYKTDNYNTIKDFLPGCNKHGCRIPQEDLVNVPWAPDFLKGEERLETAELLKIQNESLLRLLSFVATSLKDIS